MPTIQLLIYGADREEIYRSVNGTVNQFEEDKYCYGPLRGKIESIVTPNPTWWWYDDKHQAVTDEISMSLTDNSPAMQLMITIKSRTSCMCNYAHALCESIPKNLCRDIHNIHIHQYTSVSCGTNYNFFTNKGSLFSSEI